MKVKELLEELKGQYASYEIYELINKDNKKPFHTDNLWRSYDEENAIEDIWEWVLDSENLLLFYELVNEEEYNKSVLANSCETADFENLFGDKNAKVLLIAVDTGTYDEIYDEENAESFMSEIYDLICNDLCVESVSLTKENEIIIENNEKTYKLKIEEV